MLYEITEHETDIYGLKYRPSIAPKYDDGADQIVEFYQTIDSPCHFTELNERVLRTVMDEIQPMVIIEIGVHRPVNPDDASSTRILATEKPHGASYIGIDVDPKQSIRAWGEKIYTIQGHSQYSAPTYELMDKLELDTIDLLFIDGNHSVTAVVNDWRYVERLSPNGVVLLHDTSVHPGPNVIYEAVDENLFTKEKFGEGEKDWGIAVLRKI